MIDAIWINLVAQCMAALCCCLIYLRYAPLTLPLNLLMESRLPPSGEHLYDPLPERVAVLEAELRAANQTISRLDDQLSDAHASFMTRKEFDAIVGPVRSVVFGMVGLFLSAIVLGVVALLWKTKDVHP